MTRDVAAELAAARAASLDVGALRVLSESDHEDAAYRAQLYHAVLTGVEEFRQQVLLGRLRAVGQLRDGGYSYQDVADLLGISRSRAQQLTRQARLLEDGPAKPAGPTPRRSPEADGDPPVTDGRG